MKTLEEVGMREPSVTYSESDEYYFFVTGISDSGGPRFCFMFYHSEFIMVEVFPEVMAEGQNWVTVEVFKIV